MNRPKHHIYQPATRMLAITFVLWFLVLHCSGCGRPSGKTQQVTTITNESQAVALAKQEALRRNWTEITIQNARFDTGCWRVSVAHLPLTPGLSAVVYVSTNGSILKFEEGE